MSGQCLKKLPEDHIIRKSYEKHFEYRGGAESITRHSNDQCALHYAIRGAGENYTAFTNGKITLTEIGECSWDASTNRKQGHIQKKRDDQLIAAEIEALMMGEVPPLDTSPPTSPHNLRLTSKNDRFQLIWSASTDITRGSWVVGYQIHKDGQLLKMAFGTRAYIDDPNAKYEVKAVNASGTLSSSSKLSR